MSSATTSGLPSGRARHPGRRWCSATASGPASTCSSRSSTRSTRGSRWSGSTYRAWVVPRRPRCPTTSRCWHGSSGRLLDRLGYDRFDALGISWGGGLAQQLAFQYPRRCRRLVLVSTGTGMLMVPARLSVLSKMLTPQALPRPGVRQGHRTGAVRRPDAPAARRGEARGVRAGAPRVQDRVLPPAPRRGRLVEPPRSAAHPAAHPRPRRERRPDHPAGERADHARAATQRHTARLRRRPPRAAHRRRRARPARLAVPDRTQSRWRSHRATDGSLPALPRSVRSANTGSQLLLAVDVRASSCPSSYVFTNGCDTSVLRERSHSPSALPARPAAESRWRRPRGVPG